MEPSSYKQSIVDQNVVMQRMTVHTKFVYVAELHNTTKQVTHTALGSWFGHP